MRPLFLRRAGLFGTHSRSTKQQGLKAKGSILGDLLVRCGWVKPTLTLDDLDPVLADLKRKEALARARHGNVRDIREARRARVHQLLSGRA